jgi:hypothetical protein
MEDQLMTTNNNGAWVEVFSGAAFEAEVVKGLLESNGIPCIIEDHTMSALTSHYSGIGGDMRILVASADEESARKLIVHKD